MNESKFSINPPPRKAPGLRETFSGISASEIASCAMIKKNVRYLKDTEGSQRERERDSLTATGVAEGLPVELPSSIRGKEAFLGTPR